FEKTLIQFMRSGIRTQLLAGFVLIWISASVFLFTTISSNLALALSVILALLSALCWRVFGSLLLSNRYNSPLFGRRTIGELNPERRRDRWAPLLVVNATSLDRGEQLAFVPCT